MKRSILVFLLPVIFSATAAAGSGGSAYSIFGVGDLRYGSSMENAAMGGAGLAMHSLSSITPNAPATWSRLNRVRLEIGLLYEGFKSSDGDRSLYRAGTTFHGALLAIPISTPHGIVAVGGFVPYSSIDYNTFTRGLQAGIDYLLNHKGSGGLSRGLLGVSFAPLPGLALGASLDYYFGSLERSWTMVVSPPAAGGITRESLTSNGAGATASLVFDGFDRISESLRPLAIGVMLSSRAKLNATSESTYRYTAERDSSPETKGILVIPLTFGVGFAYHITDRYTVATDFVAQQWEGSEINGATPRDLRNSSRFAFGAERAGTRDALAHWVDRPSYRLGFAWNATYYRPDGRAVDEWAVTAGAGIPFTVDARLNIALEYAHRGTTANGLISDKIFRVLLSLNIGEQWFVRSAEE